MQKQLLILFVLQASAPSIPLIQILGRATHNSDCYYEATQNIYIYIYNPACRNKNSNQVHAVKDSK